MKNVLQKRFINNCYIEKRDYQQDSSLQIVSFIMRDEYNVLVNNFIRQFCCGGLPPLRS